MNIRHTRSGFTLMEVIIAVAIVAIMAGTIAPIAFKQINDARSRATSEEMVDLEDGLMDFYADTGRFPSEAEGLAALVVDPGVTGWAGPYVQTPGGNPAEVVASDSFGDTYVYDLAPTTVPAGAASLVVVSAGVNRALDSGNFGGTWDLTAMEDDLVAVVNSGTVDRENISATERELQVLAAACRDHFRENAFFPAALVDLDGNYLDRGFNNDAFRDTWLSDYAVYHFAGLPPVIRISSYGPNRADDNGAGDDLAVVVSGAAPGREKTEYELAIVQTALNGNPALVLTGVWATDRAALGLSGGFDTDGWGAAYGINTLARYVYSAGPDGNAATTIDNIPTGFGP